MNLFTRQKVDAADALALLIADELEKLERLKNSNMISSEEYTRLRARAVQ